MITVGIIANPASGKDIRRLIAHGSVFDNQEKVSIVRRVLLGLESVGVEKVVFMPDYYGIGDKAVAGIQTNLITEELPMRIFGNQDDSTRAAQIMRDMGVGSVITLGGDGTNRAVAKEIGDVPMMPISTGTNNVFPQMIEGTVAGMAAGFVALGVLSPEITTNRQLRLEIWRDGEMVDIALVDVVVDMETFIAARAVWDMSKVREIFLTRASASSIGLSAIGGGIHCAQLDRQHGVYIRLNEGTGPVELTAPIAPGLVEKVHISTYQLLNIGDRLPVHYVPSILALDGEREVKVRQGDQVTVELTDRGPVLVDMHRTLHEAASKGIMVKADACANPGCDCLLYAAGICTNPPQQCLELYSNERSKG